MEKKFQYQGSQISYTVVGTGQLVVLLHGFAEDSNIWKEQLAFLQEHCQVIVPDLPGSGKSEVLEKNDATIEDYAGCIKALIDNENIYNCILLGHSMGGYITLAFAAAYPNCLKGFGLVHSNAFADNEEKKAARQKGIKLIDEYGVYPFIKNTTPNLFSENYKREHAEKVMALIDAGKNFTKVALMQYYTAMMNRPDRTVVLQNAEVPVFFIVGSEDTAAPLQDLLKQVHLPKISHFHIINGVGHISMMEQPEQLNRYLLEFVELVD